MIRRAMRIGAATMLGCMLVLAAGAGAALAQAPAVSVFPIPGGQVAAPQTQITFRGIPAGQIGSMVVSGSQSGVHAGTIESDSDGKGGSFIPSVPFTAGETVTVQTSLNIIGGSNGRFSFTIATPAGTPGPYHWPTGGRAKGDVQRFYSRPDLVPDTIHIVKRQQKGVAPGDIFVAPQYGPVQDGPMIFDPYGNLLWFKALSGDDSASDFQVEEYQGQPVLTWWQGDVSAGFGRGEGIIANQAYQTIGTVYAGNGLTSDEHEFDLTPQGTALLTSYYPVYWNVSSIHGGSTHQVVLDCVVQEVDIKTGLVLFQWDSLDHVPVNYSYSGLPGHSTSYFDYFHVNSVVQDDDGNLLISARNTWAAYKVSHQTGAVMWQLGGKHSSFKLARGTYWAFQHDVQDQAQNDQFITLFDDSAGPPTIHGASRAVKLELNLKSMTAHQVSGFSHAPNISTNFEGNVQQLPNRDLFVGYGQHPYFTEFSPSGKILFDARFTAGTPSYRAYRFPWSGYPLTNPAVAAVGHGKTVAVYASWNGATHVKSWRVLAGSSPTSLHSVTTKVKSGFETGISIKSASYVAVQALDSAGHAMGTSPTVKG